jgi:predicted amidohydrolase YtcJ
MTRTRRQVDKEMRDDTQPQRSAISLIRRVVCYRQCILLRRNNVQEHNHYPTTGDIMTQQSSFVLLAFFLSMAFFVEGCRPAGGPADLVIRNAKIVTMDTAKPLADAIAIRGDHIVAVGSAEELQPYIGESTEVIDMQGKLVIPGFIEGHGHFMGIGSAKMNLDLMNVKNWDEVVAMVAEAVKKSKPGDWIVGRGWHQEKWNKKPKPDVEGFPTHHSLSKISPFNPVFLVHASGHAGFVNALGMKLAGIDRTTPNPSGGEILKDANGNPTGLLRETAQGLVRRAINEARAKRSVEEIEAEARKQAELAAQECVAEGITSFQDAGSSFETIDLFKRLVDEGKLPLRLWVMVRETNDRLAQNLARYRMVNYGNKHLTVRAIKVSIDGALGSRGAWLLAPYTDLPSSTGLNLVPPDTIRTTAALALQYGYQLCIHAIGDRANREVLNIYEEVFKAHPHKKDLRWRIEHAQHLHPLDIPRFGKLGVIASMQAIHCTSDAPFVIARLGEERAREGAYVWQSLMQAGAIVTNGTDAPVEDVNPLQSFYAAVTRKLNDGTFFYPQQKMSREEALASYTINAAYAAFEETFKGSLTVGKVADMVVLSKDILTVPEEDILRTRVLETIVGGKRVYKGPE